MTETLSAPLDVRLMNATASALFVAVATVGLAAVLWWGLRHPLFSIAAINVQGDLTHNNTVTLRANVAPRLSGNFFTDRKSTRLNSSHIQKSRMPSSA